MSTITLITGFAGSGKSTVSRLLAGLFGKSIHICVDDLREMMVAGKFTPNDGWSEEGYRQFQLARSSAIAMARLYASQGVDVIVDDVCVPRMFADHYAALFSDPAVRRILLLPTQTALRERIKQRGGPWDHLLGNFIAETYAYLEPMPKAGWIVLDTSDWTVEQTVREISSRIGVCSPPAKGTVGRPGSAGGDAGAHAGFPLATAHKPPSVSPPLAH